MVDGWAITIAGMVVAFIISGFLGLALGVGAVIVIERFADSLRTKGEDADD